MSFGGGGGDGVTTEINVTPLCDIFVVLLIILMMAAEAITNKGPEVDLAEIDKEVKNDAQVSVTLKKEKDASGVDGRSLYMNMVRAKDEKDLVRILTEKLRDPKLPNKHVIFCADKGLLMRDVEFIMMQIHQAIVDAGDPAPQISIKTAVAKSKAPATK